MYQLIESATGLFDKMDEDMNKGWTIGTEWVDAPDVTQRCQIVTDKIVTAIENEDDAMKTIMAAYILSRVPNIMTIHVDVNGDISDTEIEMAPESVN